MEPLWRAGRHRNPQDNPAKVVILYPFYGQRNWGPERLRNPPKVTELSVSATDVLPAILRHWGPAHRQVSPFVPSLAATEAGRPTLPWNRLAGRSHPTPPLHMPKNQKGSIYVVPQEARVESKHTQSWWRWLTTSNPLSNQLHKLFQRIEVL